MIFTLAWGGIWVKLRSQPSIHFFWLHHCNVDRLFALWQAANPTVFVQPGQEFRGTFVTKPGDTSTSASPLIPFRKAPNAPWTSDDCRDTKALGYSYPELLDMEQNKLDPRQFAAQMISRYGGKDTLRSHANNVVASQQVAGVAGDQHPIVASSIGSAAKAGPGDSQPKPAGYHPSTPNPPAGPKYTPDNEYTHVENHHLEKFREWFALIDIAKNVFSGTFKIFVFIGDVPQDHDQWTEVPSFCGIISIFARADATQCENCQDNAGISVGGKVQLTKVMMDKGIDLCLEGGETVARLKKDLKLRIYRYDTQEVIDALTIPSLRLHVLTAHVELERVLHESITDAGNGTAVHRIPKFGTWTEVAELRKA